MTKIALQESHFTALYITPPKLDYTIFHRLLSDEE